MGGSDRAKYIDPCEHFAMVHELEAPSQENRVLQLVPVDKSVTTVTWRIFLLSLFS